MKMETNSICHLEIGKSIIKRLYEYNKINTLDDETEFFPMLKLMIRGITDTIYDSKEKKNIEEKLKEFSKQLYVSMWLSHAEEDEEDEIDIAYEKKEAIEAFDSIYKNISL